MRHRSTSFGAMLSLGLLSIGAVGVLLPFAWMVSVSLKPHAEIFTTDVTLLPRHITFDNYWKALTETRIPRYLLNGVIVKSHGSANEKGVANAVAVAARLLEEKLTERITADLAA